MKLEIEIVKRIFRFATISRWSPYENAFKLRMNTNEEIFDKLREHA